MSQHRIDKAIAREFGERIRTARRSLGLGQHHLAAHLGLTRAAVASWETGRSLPSAQHLQHLSVILKIDILGVGKTVTVEPPQTSMGLADALSGRQRLVKGAVGLNGLRVPGGLGGELRGYVASGGCFRASMHSGLSPHGTALGASWFCGH